MFAWWEHAVGGVTTCDIRHARLTPVGWVFETLPNPYPGAPCAQAQPMARAHAAPTRSILVFHAPRGCLGA